jgi:hypothetical protein
MRRNILSRRFMCSLNEDNKITGSGYRVSLYVLLRVQNPAQNKVNEKQGVLEQEQWQQQELIN